MLGKTGSFVGFAGGSVGVIHTGGNFGDLHIFRAEFFQHKLIHHLADTFQAGVGFGGIVANFADKTIMFVSDKSDDFAIVEISPLASWVGRSLGELNLRRKPGINVIAIRSDGEIRVSLEPGTVIHADDRMLVVGEMSALKKLERIN